ncbi:SPFH domain-containing protein [Streptomyces sp. NPDC091376]|uniref:SPFH domain-containing protein n=1 Tax=Streptomyces sp. NPDC091376 TaxID=3365994 RepID=UPI00381B1B62
MTPTTPFSEDPPGPPLPFGRLTAASVPVRHTGPPAPGGAAGDPPGLDDEAGSRAVTQVVSEPGDETMVLPVSGTGAATEAASASVAEAVGEAEPRTEPRTEPRIDPRAEPKIEPKSLPKSEYGTATGTAEPKGDALPAPVGFERQFSGVGGRRTVVIGTETSGAIPVHLLYRDAVATTSGPAENVAGSGRVNGANGAGGSGRADGTHGTHATNGTGAANGTKQSAKEGGGDRDGDGGPDTVAMPRVSLPTGRRAAPSLVAPSRRPAPPADPRLIERPGPVLPGWAALLAGLTAVTGCAAVLHWAGAFPPEVTALFGVSERPYRGLGFLQWAVLALMVTLALFSLGGLGRGRVGHAWVLTLYGEYRGSVRRTGLMWVSPLLLRRRVDVRLRHWRSEPMPAVDANGTALEAVVLVVWRIRDTARAVLGVADHEAYLREQVEAAMARVLSQLPADAAPSSDGTGSVPELRPTLRNAEAVGDALTKTLSAECAPVGIDVFSAQPTRIEYAPEVAAAMRRLRIAALEAERRDTVLGSVVDAVDDTVQRLTMRGLVEFDDYERKALVRDLTVAFCTARAGSAETP